MQFERDALAAQAEQAAARAQALSEALEAERASGEAAPGALQQMLADAVAARDALADERGREREEARARRWRRPGPRRRSSPPRVDQLQRRLAAQEGELLAFRRAAARGVPRRPGEGESVTGAVEQGFKYEGLGNDFVVLDRRASGVDLSPSASRALCDRRRGMGADGVLVLLPSSAGRGADGGAQRRRQHRRDVRQRAALRGQVPPRPRARPRRPGGGDRRRRAPGESAPRGRRGGGGGDSSSVRRGWTRRTCPRGPGGGPFVGAAVPGVDWPGTAVSMGNPHLVLLGAPAEVVREHGPRLEHLPGFPDRTNVEAVSRAGEGLRVSVWERGSGLTDACGTGAAASVAAALVAGWVPPDVFVPVDLPGGRLAVRVSADLQRTTLRGPARFVFAAELPEALLD